MKINLTEKQKEAVFTRDCDILVSAAAGSGKTAVLSERILQQLMDDKRPASVTDFLIVTFTNAAASEMKDRIGKKIMEAASNDSLPQEMKKHLRKQLSLLAKASITTIHSFCLDVIKNNFHFLGIDPAVRVADANEAELLKYQSAEEMLEEMYAEDGQLFSELSKWLGGGHDERLLEKLLSVYRFMSGFPKPFDWIHDKVEEYNPDKIGEGDKNKWAVKLLEICRENLKGLIERAEKLLIIAEKEGIFTYEEAILKDIIVLKDYLSCFNNGLSGVLGKYVRFETVKSGKNGFDPEIVEQIKKERDKIKTKAAEICDCFAFDSENLKQQFVKVYPRLKCFEKSLLKFDSIFKQKKQKAAIIDFGDFEHLALEVLSDSSNGVADGLRERYREIMIDEYQDCNQTQEMIFSYINRKIDGESSNMFMVGDIKQSIYRFRLADPDIFAGKNKDYKSEGIRRKIVLNNNFRSSATILDGVNTIFEKIMSESLGGVEYSEEEKLYFRSNEIDKSNDSSCELVLIEKDKDAQAGEADYVAERILELLDKGYRFRDIAILIRQKNKAFEIERALKNRNIPYFSDGGNGYFESLEISMLSSVLKVIDNPMQDIELVAVLKSPAFGFDENLLAKIRLERKGPFYGAVMKYAASNEEGSDKCKDFLNRLSVWRDKVLFMPVDEFVEYIISDTGLDVFAASLPGGEQRVANIKLFVHQARLLQKSGFKGLFAFVSYMDRISAGKESGEAKMLSENSDVVRILTIHKSKGLEFPVVFLFGCDSAFNKSDTQSEIILHKNEGLGLKFTDVSRKIKYPLVSYAVVKNSLHRDNLSEEMRVLYVALTRAKERLICSATLKDAVKQLDNVDNIKLIDSTNYFEWIARAKNDENWKVEFVAPESIGNSSYETEDKKIEISENVDYDKVKEIFGYCYPFEKASELPTKLSVSEVKRRREYDSPEETKLYIPEISEMPGFLSEKSISPTDKGIINHLILKHIDINLPDVDGCARDLVKKGLLAENEVSAIETEGIINFFESDVGKRLKNSDKVFRELPFGINIPASELFPSHGYGDEKIMLQGIIDLIFVEGEKTILLDYKTDGYLSEDTKEKYKTQLELYSVAAAKVLGRNIDEKYLYMLKHNQLIKI